MTTVSAHNFVEVWHFTNKDSCELKQRVFCEEECILYSADYQAEYALVAAGTVFRAVLIWKVDKEERQKVLLKLEGHGGVIFDVKFLRKDLVASVSDDRSLRVWRLFLAADDIPRYQQLGEYYGHRSRIWKLSELGYSGLLVTASEDATCKIWDTASIYAEDQEAVVA